MQTNLPGVRLRGDAVTRRARQEGEELVKVYRAGEYFGELALLTRAPRRASLRGSEEAAGEWRLGGWGGRGACLLLGNIFPIFACCGLVGIPRLTAKI